jgi:hypothetical protein
LGIPKSNAGLCFGAFEPGKTVAGDGLFHVHMSRCLRMGRRCEGTMTEPAERNRARLPDDDRREIAKRIFDALCAKFPEKYVALVQPGDIPTPAVEV